MRATDEMVRSFLQWARNYGEITNYELIASRGRKWKITLPAIATKTGAPSDDLTNFGASAIVPATLVMTNREAIAFGYGLAVAGSRPTTRREFAAREWGW